MWQGIDKRRFPRANYPCEIIIMKKAAADKISTHTENIGAGGICVILSQGLDRFSDVELILILNDKQPPIDCEARVVWTVKRSEPAGQALNQVDTGIEFVNLKEKDKLRIEKVVKKCLREQNSRANT